MKSMSSRERFLRMYQHREADRVPIIDAPWAGTMHRWINEGLPKDADWRETLDIDKAESILVDISPQYTYKVIEEKEDYIVFTSNWGATLKVFKYKDSTPQFLDYKIKDATAWKEAKSLMQVNKSRVDWNYLKTAYPVWKAEDRWVEGGFWFGFDVTHSWTVGLETLMIAMIEEPEWVTDMFDTFLNCCITYFDMIWDAGYTFDCINWPDDMGYKGTPFFSNEMYRNLLQPFHRRAVEWAHSKGIYAHLHSCGDIMPLIPDILDTGIDALNPLEVKAGMDSLKLKKEYGNRLVLHGGINAVLWDDKDKIISEIERLVPVLKENGGYIFSSDHSIPNTVSLENFKQIIATVKRVGAYK